jgi:enoyl-CoA hydratase/carnithine racemase
MDGPIRTRTDGAVLEIAIDRPKANAIDLATSRTMGELFRGFRDDDALRVAILRPLLRAMRSMAIMASADLAACRNCHT